MVLLGLAPYAQTYAEGGLSLSPPLKEVTLSPGLIQASIDITLTNAADVPINASYKLIDLKSLGQYGGSTLDKAGLPDSYNLANWMSLPAGNTQRIAGNETTTIKIIIDNRSDLAPGGHYGALVITASPDEGPSSSISLNQQIISLIFVKKLGGEKFGLNLESFDPSKPTSIPDNISLHFKNTGNVHVIPRGYIEVRDNNNKLISKGIINPDSTLILPGATKDFITIMKPVSDTGFKGTYTLTIYYRYDGQTDFSSRSIVFGQSLVSGRNLILLIVGSLALVSIAGGLFYRRRVKATRKN